MSTRTAMTTENRDQREVNAKPNSAGITGGGAVLGATPCSHVCYCRGSRCGVCYWGLYDGDWCQNKNCEMSGKSVGENRIHLTNEEAQILIKANSILEGQS